MNSIPAASSAARIATRPGYRFDPSEHSIWSTVKMPTLARRASSRIVQPNSMRPFLICEPVTM
jgi:hypothetical protein